MKSPNLRASFGFARDGLRWAWGHERNFRIHTLAATLSILAGGYFGLSRWEWLALAAAITQVMVAELLNTAVENVVDLASPQVHPLARVAKNVAAAAVLLSAFFAVAVGYVLFAPRLWLLWQPGR
ncbi:MAG: diacylglycerol kinase family protein [Firmicutes bacterium]|nr:diacylglycerol kinase family protein [Bacillota bacterium]